MKAKLVIHGWEYIVVDIQWYEPNATGFDYRKDAKLDLDEWGRLIPATNKFPSAVAGKGFKPLADFVHSLGLKFGVHLMRGIPRQAVAAKAPIKGTQFTAADIADTSSICSWNPDMYGVDMTRPGAQAYYDSVFAPALEAAGKDVEFLGELVQADRDQLFAESYASLMPGSWPEPFGLVAIEAMACGTPVIARRIGALPEIIRDGVDGFFGDDVSHMAFKVAGVADLDRAAIRASVLERFSAARMTDGYEAVYAARLGTGSADDDGGSSEPTPLDARRAAAGGMAASRPASTV
jgi:glycosyltransferase involved in cell wall biosynthesis